MVSEECKTKYYGCMDSFCMLDNTNGGRCLCSDRNAELDTVLAEIQKLDDQSYAMATTGVERIEMGEDADDVQRMVDKIVQDVQNSDTENKNQTKTRARTLNLDAWNDIYETDDENVFGNETNAESDISNLTGDALQASVSNMCAKQIPECSANLSMLKLMYAQQIKSDCSAYENTLKQQKNASAKKLQTAQTALREAALEQHQNANKYDLGQCTIRFKQCMQTTADCGEDFSKCATVVATEKAQEKVGSKKKNVQTYEINTGLVTISIAASTYDIITSKKPMCESVTKQCTKVKDKVWDTFLREVAPELKSAELLAESNLRTSCIGNISECFQKACKDNIDPNDPDGSYDMCLSRPETVRSLCKVQIDPCEATEPKILDYVYARLASMRVDSCTKEVKECLQSDDRCGKDYTQCVGLDTDTIINLCPSDKLTACNVDKTGQKLEQSAVYDNIENIISGIMLNIDNSMLTTCQNAVSSKKIELCGDGEGCAVFDNNDTIGTGSLISYKRQDGAYVIEGLLTFGNVKIKTTESTSNDVKFGKYELDISGYSDNIKNVSGTSAVKDRVLSTLQSTQNELNQKIAILTSDPKISMCINGRDMTQIRKSGGTTAARYPHLLDSVIMEIINAGLDQANKNYHKQLEQMITKATESASDEYKTAICAAMAAETGGDFTELFKDNFGTNSNGIRGEGYDVLMVIDGIKMDKVLSASTLGKGSFVQTDEKGNTIASIVVTSVYSPETNICTMTTTTTVCESMEAVYDESAKKVKKNGKKKNWKKTLAGTICKSMSEPITQVEEIQL